MHPFRTDAKLFAASLKRVIPAIERRDSIPILALARLTVIDGCLRIVGNNLDMQIETHTLPVDGSGDFDVCADPRHLGALLRALSGETVKVDVAESSVVISWSDGEARLPSLPSTDFPMMKPGDVTATAQIEPTFVGDILDRVAKTMGVRETRYYLTGACIDMMDGAPVVVSIDGHRMTAMAAPLAALAAGRPIIPRRSIEAWRLLGRGERATLSLHGSSFATVDTGAVKITTKIIDGTFPDCSRLLAPADTKTITFERPSLATGLSRARIGLSGAKGSKALKITTGPGVAKFSVSSFTFGKIEHSVPAGGEVVGEFGVNANYFAEALDLVSGNQIALTLEPPNGPIRISGDQDAPGSIFLLMPLHV